MKIPHLNHMKAWCDDGKVSVNWYSQSISLQHCEISWKWKCWMGINWM